ncbi:MAG: DUF4270 domain-containing protein [Cytophagales bacterium]|nr:DUF4270 domain-containing protein [Cytophagales bacterium]
MALLAPLIFACEDPGEIGLDLNPENGAFVARFQEIPVDNSVLLYEDIVADNATRIDSFQNIGSAGRLLTGSFDNQSFGKVKSTAFAGLYLGKVGFTDDDYVFDSLVFNIKVDYMYGNSFLGTKKIYIHELADSLKTDTLYLTRNSTPYHDTPLGEFAFDLSALDTVWIDTVLTTKLSDELGKRFLQEAKDNESTYLNNKEFRKFFNGFAFVSDEANNMVAGIIPENNSTFLRMHFHNNEDTTSFDFIFQDFDTINFNSTKYYNHISLDRSGTPIEGITEFYTEYQTSNDLSYIQASTGVFTKLDIQPYLNFIDTIDHLVINRAEIEIPVQSFSDNTVPSSGLDMYVVDQNNRFVEEFIPRRPLPIYITAGRLIFSRNSNENEGKFEGIITEYIQGLTSGDSQNTQLLLGQTNLWNSVLSVNQSVLKKDKIVLKVYYSVLQ